MANPGKPKGVIVPSVPLEREYEAWTVSELETTLQRIGMRFTIAAVSPHRERHWPADEALNFHGKVLGLQFKRPHGVNTGSGTLEAGWNLRSKYDQMRRIRRLTDIYYVLPTFLDRKYKAAALHSCLFWRPSPRHTKLEVSESYLRPKSLHSGQLIKGIVDCTLGRRPPGTLPVSWYVQLLADTLAGRQPLPESDGTWRGLDRERALLTNTPDRGDEAPEPDEAFYVIAIETERGESIRLG